MIQVIYHRLINITINPKNKGKFMKKRILKPILDKDKKIINDFFKNHKDIYYKTPITAKMLSIHLGYRENDIINCSII